ncbi:tRNA U-34 5-methylaminomethyl-2-thiouridine biosynthesis protein MnmC, C-terminal domain [Spongiibacter sp. IMCC21906]|uniref:bifunctional tRNA (5-methylaminomethyl-2-thiouridine)(34)-methyltransferase MnmD/FAD-dependent 5-carboxymethylaminomethyl-2-thiouridine(34) oxidoreductase MnmC n=1 Tax=Spongiibacter sp. IMCC21906 TaxID=1620392 RepID=UPI00062DF315|nr:bifunctional tRNA (5-methylaminomethyl-2-thiouridine)(34)-methyltransferase MnmD/FAD-dependent 5-carboxymethylaminomethyl-2-thiouridine(34) oxidoreductase MnmC [Spongiibacter sp. IMCC21906]AKH69599.1 tRNA U-34 5-methylaminomethyl-2-thiouridine biosynthesis protein MnmC, C-terminal domain [Spongiibacter sp. IMCC21906]
MDNANPYYLQTADVEWQDGVPVAKAYSDGYFSKESSLAENRHVFLHHNDLAQRWHKLHALPPGTFTIIETGFGTGLNFLIAWQLWQQTAPSHWQLHYISIDKHPMRTIDLQKAHQSWPELCHLASILQHNYPPLVPGRHRRLLNCERVCLDLFFGDVSDGLTELILSSSTHNESQKNSHSSLAADAWFLDGFAPQLNPDMWQETLLDSITTLSKPGSSFAASTGDALVCRGLITRGFSVATVNGLDHKPAILHGRKNTQATSAISMASNSNRGNIKVPWHNPFYTCPSSNRSSNNPLANKVTIIGAGLAGASTARALATRGYQVEVIERGSEPAQGASGNPQGVLYTKLSAELGSLNRFTLTSFLHALGYYRPLIEQQHIIGELCGVLQMASTHADKLLFEKLKTLLKHQDWLTFVSPEQASVLAGIPLHAPAFYYPGAGWLSPPALCKYWLNHDAITVKYNTEVREINYQESQWQLSNRAGKTLAETDILVIANSHEAKTLSCCGYLPTRAIRGQLSYLSPKDLAYSPKKVVCHEGYFAPATGENFCIGASFNLKDQHCELSDMEHHWNIQQLRKLSPELLHSNAEALGGRAALRCTSPDYHPIVGPVPDLAKFDIDYKRLRKDAKATIDSPGSYQPGLYLNIAHGSRGLTSSPICAELIASYIGGEFPPLDRALCENLSPARFVIRDLKKNRR